MTLSHAALDDVLLYTRSACFTDGVGGKKLINKKKCTVILCTCCNLRLLPKAIVFVSQLRVVLSEAFLVSCHSALAHLLSAISLFLPEGSDFHAVWL